MTPQQDGSDGRAKEKAARTGDPAARQRAGNARGNTTTAAAHAGKRAASSKVGDSQRAGGKGGAAEPAGARDLLELYRPDFARTLADLQAHGYRHEQVVEHLFRRPLLPFSVSTVLPGDVRAALDEEGASSLTVSTTRTSRDRTTKLLLATKDGEAVEMVIMRYQRRVTACISSQVGCPVGCAFCATGQHGLARNLSVAEVVDQVRIASAIGAEEGWRVSNLVYMGMGEPLLNLQAVLDSIRVLTNPRGLGLGHRSISISTVGIPAGIRRLARSEPQVNLALSLHAADDQTRAQLVPDKFRQPLAKILAAAWDHFEITRRKLLVEYVLLQGINDSTSDARRLAGLLKGHVVTVNLLAWNPVAALAGFTASEPAVVAAFRDTLTIAGVEAVIRHSKGAGIDAACGQLAGRRRRVNPPSSR